MDSVGDPGFVFHVAMAQVWGLTALRLAGTAASSSAATPSAASSSAASSSVATAADGAAADGNGAPTPLPMNFTLQAEAIRSYVAAAKLHDTRGHVDYTALDAATASFATAARHAMKAEHEARTASLRAAATAATTSPADAAAAVAALDERLAYTERQFLSAGGLPGRKYFKHVLQAPGLYTGYAPKTLPGVYDAVAAGDWTTANEQAAIAAARIEAAAKFLQAGLVEGA